MSKLSVNVRLALCLLLSNEVDMKLPDGNTISRGDARKIVDWARENIENEIKRVLSKS